MIYHYIAIYIERHLSIHLSIYTYLYNNICILNITVKNSVCSVWDIYIYIHICIWFIFNP